MDARRVGIAMDFSVSSKHALQWALQNLVRNKDHLLLLIVLHKTAHNAPSAELWKDEGSPLIPFGEFKEVEVLQKYGVKQDLEVFNMLEAINREKEDIVIVGKVYWGEPREKLHQAVSQMKLDCLVMGSRGLGTIKAIIMGSVSSYIVTHAECPVTIVKLPPLPTTN